MTRSQNLFLEMTFSKKRLVAGALCSAFVGSLVAIYATFLQKIVVDNLSVSQTVPWKILLSIFIFTLLSQVLSFVARYLCLKQATAYFSVLSMRVYRHTLALKPRARQSHSVGELISFYAQDMAATVAYLEEFLPSAIVSMIPLLCVPVAAHFLHDVPLWGPLLVMALTFFLFAIFAYRQAVFFGAAKKMGEKRLGYVNEWLQNIKMIRALSIERTILNRILSIRKEETLNRKRTVTNGSTMNAISQVSPLCINIAGLLLFVQQTKGQLTAGDVLGIFWLYGVLCARPLRSLPWAIVTYLDANSSRKRLEAFLSLPTDDLQSNPSVAIARQVSPQRPSLVIENLNLSLGQKHILKNVSFVANEGEFICIVGDVGSGKSMFLNSLLKEAEATFGLYEIFGMNTKNFMPAQVRSFFGLVPQSSFVMSSNLRDNVSFEYDTPQMKDDEINSSLKLSAFVPSQEWMEEGLNTEIGERGVNLSGGQKQRVSLARVHLHNSQILLLDDTLSALDSSTEKEIQTSLLLGDWKLKTRILVTHRHSILPFCDAICFFHKGKVAGFGKFENLMATNEKFSQFVLKKRVEAEKN